MMGALFCYELKKLFSQKMLWLALAVGTAILVLQNIDLFSSNRNGVVAGSRYAYASLEGRILTDGLSSEAEAAMDQYISRHPEEFKSYDEDGKIVYYPSTGFSVGVWTAYNDIINADTEEKRMQDRALYESYLANGHYEDGAPLTYANKQYYVLEVANHGPTVVHYAEGWKTLSYLLDIAGMCILLPLLLGLLPLFAGETTARMEGIFITSANARKAVLAKLLVALCLALVLAVWFCGLQITIVGLTYGLEGAGWTADTLDGRSMSYGKTFAQVFLTAGAVLLLSALACAMLAACSSALCRHPLTSLISTAALIGVQLLLSILIKNARALPLAGNWFGFYLYRAVQLLPAAVLPNPQNLFVVLAYPYCTSMGLLISLSIALADFLLACRWFLQPRKI